MVLEINRRSETVFFWFSDFTILLYLFTHYFFYFLKVYRTYLQSKQKKLSFSTQKKL